MRTRQIALISAAVLTLVGGVTAAAAAISSPVDSGGVIHGCYTTKAAGGSHALVLQDAGTSCPSGTTAISWSQQGPPGPQGSTGPSGPAGPSGPPGPTVTATVTVTPSPTSTLIAKPDNNAASPVNLGILQCGSGTSVSGVNVGSSSAWYSVTLNDTSCSLQLQVVGHGNVMDVLTNPNGPPLQTGVQNASDPGGSSYLVRVYEGGTGTDGQFTLSATGA